MLQKKREYCSISEKALIYTKTQEWHIDSDYQYPSPPANVLSFTSFFIWVHFPSAWAGA